MRAIWLATALALTPAMALADIAISGQDGKQVRAGDGLPMVPTPDSVAVIEFSSSKAPRVIGLLGGLLDPDGAAQRRRGGAGLQFRAGGLSAAVRPGQELMPQNKVAVIGLDNVTKPTLAADG